MSLSEAKQGEDVRKFEKASVYCASYQQVGRVGRAWCACQRAANPGSESSMPKDWSNPVPRQFKSE